MSSRVRRSASQFAAKMGPADVLEALYPLLGPDRLRN
jgi:hypothetical protein